MADFDIDIINQFGETVKNDTYGWLFTAVFDNTYQIIDNVGSSVPTLTFLSSVEIGKGDKLVIQNKTYSVRELMPDGTGITVAILE
jgi:hypothetical protein